MGCVIAARHSVAVGPQRAVSSCTARASGGERASSTVDLRVPHIAQTRTLRAQKPEVPIPAGRTAAGAYLAAVAARRERNKSPDLTWSENPHRFSSGVRDRLLHDSRILDHVSLSPVRVVRVLGRAALPDPRRTAEAFVPSDVIRVSRTTVMEVKRFVVTFKNQEALLSSGSNRGAHLNRI